MSEMSHEAFVIGALLIDPQRTLRETEGLLTPDSFQDNLFRELFAAALDLRKEGLETDAVVLLERLSRDNIEVDKAYVRSLMAGVPTLESLSFYAERVAEAYDGRNLRAAMLDACQRIADGDAMSSVLPEMEAMIASVKTRGASAGVSSEEAMQDAWSALASAAGGQSLFVGTGYGKLNNILGGGFIKSGLHILAARPGTGKTTLALQIAENVAAKGIKTLFISLEMSIDQLQHRRLATAAGVPLGDILGIGKEDRELWSKLSKASATLASRPLYFNRSGGLSVPRIERLARSLEVGFVVIDYLGLIQHSGTRSIYEKVTETSNALKRMAVALNIPILCLCQLNRESDGKAPKVSELRDSGAIEQDADTICLQWLPGGRPEEGKNNGITPVELSLIVAKNRHGAQGRLALDWYMSCGRIRE